MINYGIFAHKGEEKMSRRKSSIKKIRVDKKRHLKNSKVKQELKKTIKKFHVLLSTKNSDGAKTLLSKVYSLLDKAAKKKIIHPATADRKKGRLTKRIGKIA
jgi:small subunit ribosomal protein S20